MGNVTDVMNNEPVETVAVDTKEEPAPKATVTDNDEEDTMSYFEKLAEKD